MTEPILSVTDFSFAVEKRTILKNLTFSVDRGERVTIVGPNGAGKTTLLKCLNRINRGGSGRILVEGQPLVDLPQWKVAQRLAYVPQADGRTAPFSVCEFVMMGRYSHMGPLKSSGPEDDRATRGALEVTGTLELADRPFNTLSGGEQQKILIAAALAQEAKILLLDEPTAFLDPPHQVEIHRMLGRLHENHGVTLIWVTHDLNAALSHSDRVIALREGTLVFDGPAVTLAESDRLRNVFGHDFLVAPHPKTGHPVIFPE